MIKQKQLNLHNPDTGVFGDCHRTSIACLLDLPPEAVPNWAELYWDDMDAWIRATDEFLALHGLAQVSIPYNTTLDTLLEHHGVINPNTYYLLTGESIGGTNHVVICKGGQIEWDPSQDNSGIVAPCKEDSLFWVNFLIPLRFKGE